MEKKQQQLQQQQTNKNICGQANQKLEHPEILPAS